MNQNLENFTQDVSSILQYDYGDFMRSANTYLNHLRDVLSSLGDAEINKKIDDMQSYLQFSPNWDDVEGTRAKLLRDAHYLDEVLAAHQGDLLHH
jgi:hypothetical protein